MTRVALASTNEAFETRFRDALAGQVPGDLHLCRHLTEGGAAADALAPPGTEVVVLGPGLPSEERFALAAAIDASRPEISVVLVAEHSSYVLEQALRTGIREVVPPDADAETLRAAVVRALERTRARTGPPDEPVPGDSSRIVTVASPKGGAGKTIVATNLAVGLAMRQPGEVVLVDMDLQFGDVATALGMLPQHTVADVLRFTGTLDATAVKAFLCSHPSSLHALCAPLSPADRDDISGDLARRVIELLASQFPYVVVDTAAGLDEHALSALEVSTDCILVATMDVPSVRSVRKEREVLHDLGLDRARQHLVLNRTDTGLGMEPKDVELTVGLPVDVTVASARAVQLSMNQGAPLMQSDPRSPAARQLERLVDRFLVQDPSSARRFPRLRRSAA